MVLSTVIVASTAGTSAKRSSSSLAVAGSGTDCVGEIRLNVKSPAFHVSVLTLKSLWISSRAKGNTVFFLFCFGSGFSISYLWASSSVEYSKKGNASYLPPSGDSRPIYIFCLGGRACSKSKPPLLPGYPRVKLANAPTGE
ncbi:hypothetical protein D3C85_1294140 [compost metagenome]